MSVVTVGVIAMLSAALGFLTAAILAAARSYDEREERERTSAIRRLPTPSPN